MSSSEIFICGGGTGGHFFSGLALAEKILEYYPDKKIRFIGTLNGIEARTELNDSRMAKTFIAAKGLIGKNLINRFLGILSLAKGVLQSFFLIISNQPSVVIGVGGYASAPTVFAALLLKPFLRHRVFLLEQNSHAGVSNRLMNSLGAKGYSGFDLPGFETVNLPLRSASQKKSENKKNYSWPAKTILVVGGSQGARGLNKKWLEIVPEFVQLYPTIKIIHQTGKLDEQMVRDFYKNKSINAEVFAFSNEMPKYYDEADFLICRSGAMTVFEVMAFERPALFIPFPAAAEDHQYKNAIAVHSRDWVIRENEFTWLRLKQLLELSSVPLPGANRQAKRSWKEILAEWFSS